MRHYLRQLALKLLLKPYQPLKDDRLKEILAIRDTNGYKAILSELNEMADNAKRIDWLVANYGKMNLEQVGALPTAGIITSHIIEAIIAKINE